MKIAHWANFEADPEARAPFPVRIGVTDEGAIDELRIEACKDIPDAAEKAMALIKAQGLARTKRFYFIYPRYAVDQANENTMNVIAGLVLDESQKHGVGFERGILRLQETDLEDPLPPEK